MYAYNGVMCNNLNLNLEPPQAHNSEQVITYSSITIMPFIESS